MATSSEERATHPRSANGLDNWTHSMASREIAVPLVTASTTDPTFSIFRSLLTRRSLPWRSFGRPRLTRGSTRTTPVRSYPGSDARATDTSRLSSWRHPWTRLGGLYRPGKHSAARSLTGADSQTSQSATTTGIESTTAPTSNLPDFPVLSTSQPISPSHCVDTPGDYEDTYSPGAWLAGGPPSRPGDRRDSVVDDLERIGAALLSGPDAEASRSAWPLTNNQVIVPPEGCSTTQATSIPRRPVPSYGSIGQAVSTGVARPASSSSATLTDSLPRLQRPSVPGGSYENEFRSFAAQSGALLPLEDTSDGEPSRPSAFSTSTPSAFSTIAKSAGMVAAGLAVAGTALYFGGSSTAFVRQVQEDQWTMGQLSRVGDWMASGIMPGMGAVMGAVSSLTRSWQGDGHAGGGGGYNIASVWS